MKKILVLALVLLTTGCLQSAKLLKVGDSKMWDSYTVATSEDINETKSGNLVSWTQYGPILELVQFWKPVEDGKKLPFTFTSASEGKAPVFKSAMSPDEVVEIYRSSIVLVGHAVTKVTPLEPVNYGSKQGYRFDLHSSDANGVDYRSRSVFTLDSGKLYLITLTANATHYFEKRTPFFDSAVASIQF